jgi:hypothetical protein
MRIDEVEADNTADRLMALARFAAGRAEDTSAKMQMPVDAFINRAQSMGIDINADTLQTLVGQPPLNGIFNPMEPNATELTFKGNEKPGPVTMPVTQAQDIVANAAQSALNKNRGV